MKKIIFLIFLFIIYSLIILFIPEISAWDKTAIVSLQNIFTKIPIKFLIWADCKLYSLLIILPLVLGGMYFLKKKKYIDMFILFSAPLFPYLLNCLIKPLIHRARPPFELQLSIHPDSFSYVSSHSLVTFCLWGLVIYYTNKYSDNKFLNSLVYVFALIWILFEGLSRILLGVHNPTDVIGAYFLGFIILSIYSELIKRCENV